MPVDELIKAGKLEEAWRAIDELPSRQRFSSPVLRQRLTCAVALGWERRARMLEEVLAACCEIEAA